MTQTLVPDQLTPVSHEDLIVGLRDAIPIVWNRPAVAKEISVYYGQGLIENGASLESVHCFDIGNVKATPRWDGLICQYQCDETVSADEAAHAKTLGPCDLILQPSGKVRVVCYPPHPWTTFRAFESLAKALVHYLQLFTLPQYQSAAARALAGDAVGFVQEAKRGGYFTAPDVSAYARGVASIALHALPQCEAAVAGASIALSDDQRQTVSELVLQTLSDAASAITDPAPPPDEVA